MHMDNMTIAEKVSYIKGLAEGLGVNEDTDEGRVIKALIDVLGDIAVEIEAMSDDINDISDNVFEITENVTDLEDTVYGEDIFDDDDFDEHDRHRMPFRRGHGAEDDMYEVVCPNCGEELTIDFGAAARGYAICPECGSEFDLEFGEELDDFDDDFDDDDDDGEDE